MAKDIKQAIFRSKSTLLGDFAGAASLMGLLYAALWIPGIS